MNPFQNTKDRTYAFIEGRNEYGSRKRKNSRRNQRHRQKVSPNETVEFFSLRYNVTINHTE